MPQQSQGNNTERDSIYAQVAASRSNVYVVWQVTEGSDNITLHENSSSSTFDSLYSQNKEYDIYFRKSTDGGITFEKDISVTIQVSQHPQ